MHESRAAGRALEEAARQLLPHDHHGQQAEALGVDLSQLPLAELQSLEAGVTEAVYKVLTPEASCASRQSFGGTAPEQVRARIAEWKTRLA